MIRTEELDALEAKRIEANEQMLESGDCAIDTFSFEEYAIHNPYLDYCGMETVDPVEFYGQAYIDWYNRKLNPVSISETFEKDLDDIEDEFLQDLVDAIRPNANSVKYGMYALDSKHIIGTVSSGIDESSIIEVIDDDELDFFLEILKGLSADTIFEMCTRKFWEIEGYANGGKEFSVLVDIDPTPRKLEMKYDKGNGELVKQDMEDARDLHGTALLVNEDLGIMIVSALNS